MTVLLSEHVPAQRTQPTPDTFTSRGWTFLTNHAHALLCLANGEPLTARELAIGITDRAVQAILSDLTEEGYLIKSRQGRRNTYKINPSGRLRHPLEAHHTVRDLINALK
jgi:DNA-binding transcriptional ArsR family regulator